MPDIFSRVRRMFQQDTEEIERACLDAEEAAKKGSEVEAECAGQNLSRVCRRTDLPGISKVLPEAGPVWVKVQRVKSLLRRKDGKQAE